MMIKLISLQIQLENLKVVLEEAIVSGKSREEMVKILDQIKEVDKLIKERKEFLNNNQN
jgi:hypothetical protein